MQPLHSEVSQAFDRLDERIQRWVYEQGWTRLHEAQERAVAPVLAGNRDLIIAAATASGKTEAAFLPILSRLLAETDRNPCVLYISPLKALINDQFFRMEQLCERLSIPVHRWHGDVQANKKKKFRKQPSGVLLITPESVESLFTNHGNTISYFFSGLLYIVVDELHSFIATERGRQLQSLLHRIDLSTGKKVPRIGLSATIGDMQLASRFLRQKPDLEPEIIASKTGGQELQLLIKGYIQKEPDRTPEGVGEIPIKTKEGSLFEIAEDLFRTLRGKNNLIFANTRGRVEHFSDLLRAKCEENLLPNEFWPHHGSLAKETREQAEKAIKDRSRPVSIVCTSTLEMGIDIGSVASVAQVGPPPSVASLRQRLGRSGRRGEAAILRIYIQEQELDINSSTSSHLHARLIQTIAMVNLLLEKWYEPPTSEGLHLSTLIQQILSLIAQHGGVAAPGAYEILCKKGPFSLINHSAFIELLRSMEEKGLIMQASDGLLLHGKMGERIVNHHSFYVAFQTPVEYRLVSGDKTLGTLPAVRPIIARSHIIFGGKRWFILKVNSTKKVIFLKPAKGGIAPVFDGEGGMIHDRVRQEMFAIYRRRDIPPFLDRSAKDLLSEARENFHRFRLENRSILQQGNNSQLFCWMGDRVADTISLMLRSRGIESEHAGISINATASRNELQSCLRALAKEGLPNISTLTKSVENMAREKYDLFLPDELLSADYVSARLDREGALRAIQELVKREDARQSART